MKRYIVEYQHPKWVVLDSTKQKIMLLVSDKRFAHNECKRLNAIRERELLAAL